MAHRLAFMPNQNVPLAVQVRQRGSASLTPHDPLGATEEAHPSPPDSNFTIETELDFLALDVTPLDHMVPSEDSVHLQLRFTDTLGRRVEVQARDVILGMGDDQHYGGVATNLYETNTDSHGHTMWNHRPLVAWTQCEIRVNDALTDSGIVGQMILSEHDALTRDEDAALYALTFHVLPRRLFHDARIASFPLQAAEELGMPGWVFRWDEISYSQVPVMAVRVERGDSVEKIAKEMAVDVQNIFHANQHLDDDELRPGDLLRIPMLPRPSSLAPRKTHPSMALTWKEIVKGWTMLN